MRNRIAIVLAGVMLGAGAASVAAQDSAAYPVAGTVYTATNATAGNAVLVFHRLADGQLQAAGSVATGGAGTGGGLGNQGGLVMTDDARWLLVVNAGSNSLSVLDARGSGLRLADVQPTGGSRPVSVTAHRGLVYVLHAGSDDITGFRLGRRGQLTPIAGSTRGLSGTGTAAAQVGFSPDGDLLVVTERATNQIVTFTVDEGGVPGPALVQASSGVTPFGFAFRKRHQLIVSEAFGGAAGASATSSYSFDDEGRLTTISASVPTTQTAACWAVVTPDGRFAYVTDAGSGVISGYAIASDGRLFLLDPDGRTGVTGDGSTPVDLSVTRDGQFVYSLNSGSHTIGAFRILRNGELRPLPFLGGIPIGANGLAAK